jgi:Uma2 family endonuclease
VTVTGLTMADLEAMPDDGRRYELIGGAIVMTPAPGVEHQRVSRRLQRLLEDAWPEMEIFNALIDLDLPGEQRVQPDLVAVERGRTGRRLSLPVALVVEIVSPGSTTNDRVTKRATYAAAGIPAYWIVDPVQGAVTCFVLSERDYLVVAEGATVALDNPVPLRIDLPALLEP